MFAVWVSLPSSGEEEPEKEVGNFWVCRLRRYQRDTNRRKDREMD